MDSNQILPRELRLTAPGAMPQARSYLFKQRSTEILYDSADMPTIQIDIPRLQRSYLTKDSYLKFRLGLKWINVPGIFGSTVPSGPCFDLPGAFGLFDKIEVYDYLGSTLLESTSGHGQLMALLMDTQNNTSEQQFHYATNSGCKGGRTVKDLECGLGANTGLTDNYILQGPTSGYFFQVVGVDENTHNDGRTYYYDFSIPLFSFLGLLSQKFAPLHNGYTLKLTLNSVANAFGFAYTDGTFGTTPGYPPANYGLENVYFCAQILELGPLAESMLMSSMKGPLVVPTKMFRNYTGQIIGNPKTYRLDLNINVASLTNILFIMRHSDALNDIKFKSLSYRIRNHLLRWWFQYGSTMLPTTSGIRCSESFGLLNVDNYRGGYDEAYYELMKARHNFNASNFNTLINRRNFWIDNADIAGVYEYFGVNTAEEALALTTDNLHETGKFAGGLDLELVSGKANDLICGMNTNGMNTSIHLEFDPDRTVKDARIDAWAEHDAFINVTPGIATTVSF